MAKKKNELRDTQLRSRRLGLKTKNTTTQESLIQNGMFDAMGFGQFNPFNLPQGSQGFPGTEQISGTNTLFKNLRWYLVSNFRQLLNELYVEIGLIKTIVDVPVDDALRGGIELKSKQLDEHQIEELQISMDRDDDINTVGQGAKWNRLFGGAGILILTDQDPELPLDLTSIGTDTPLEFRAVDMWELFWDKQNTEGYDPSTQSQDFETYDYYGEKIHKSRVMRMKGLQAPSFIRPRLRGWGFSVVEQLVRSINQYIKATDVGYEVIDEFKVDVYKIKNLVNTLMSPNGNQKIQQRIQLANYQKNYQNAIVMDGEDDWDHKQLSFAGFSEYMDSARMQVAADMRIPRSKLFGEAGGGLNSGANEGDLEVYNSMVESEVRNKIKYDLLRVCEIKCQKLFGFVPDDLSLTFKPLRVLSAEQEENVKTQKFARLLQAKQLGELTTLEFRDACNKGNLFDVKLDTSEDSLNPDDPEIDSVVKEGVQDPSDPEDIDNPGADREDTQKSKMFPKGEYGGKKDFQNDGDWEEGKHPRQGDGKFGSGAGKDSSKSEKKKKPHPHEAEIAKLLEEAEKADDSNSHHKAETLREKARKLEKEMKSKKNSTEFDLASYEADGGDNWIDDRRKEFFDRPVGADQGVLSRAKSASQKAFGKENWKFTAWMYRKLGGKFH